MTNFESWFVLLWMHWVWIVCTQCMSICSFVKGHSMGSPTCFLSSKYSILGRSLRFSDSLVTNKHTEVCWRKAGRISRNSVWPPLSMRYTQSQLRSCCDSDVDAIRWAVFSSNDIVVNWSSEYGLKQQYQLTFIRGNIWLWVFRWWTNTCTGSLIVAHAPHPLNKCSFQRNTSCHCVFYRADQGHLLAVVHLVY